MAVEGILSQPTRGSGERRELLQRGLGRNNTVVLPYFPQKWYSNCRACCTGGAAQALAIQARPLCLAWPRIGVSQLCRVID